MLALKVMSSVDLVVEIYTLPALEVQTKERRQRQNESPVKVYSTISLLYMSGWIKKAFNELANTDNNPSILAS